MSTPPPPTQYGESPGRTSVSVASSRASSIPMSYSMDSEGASLTHPPTSNIQGGVGRESPEPGNLPPAYALQHSGHIRGASTSGTSFATTEDSIDSRMDQTIEDSLLSQSTGYEGLGTNSQQRLAQMGSSSPANKGESELNQYYQYQQDQEGYNTLQPDNNNQNLSTVNESYQSSALDTSNNTNEDATLTIYTMRKKSLQLLSNPQLFNDAISWQEQLDMGIDPSIPTGSSINNIGQNVDTNKLNSGFETEFDDDSTFKGLVDDDTTTAGASTTKGGDGNKGEIKVAATQDETFEFNPNSNTNKTNKEVDTKEEEVKPKEEPLPIQIFAHDAEVVLPQALTATQLFGIERITGIELEAAAGIIPLSHLFMRWLALMPEGDHVNVIDPPGLTVMKILGGGYRVTGAHRVVWRYVCSLFCYVCFVYVYVIIHRSIKLNNNIIYYCFNSSSM